MQVTKTVEETRALVKAWKKEGKTIGLVPTMGYLHEGHASLIKKCREENDIVVVSVFVNPTQFGPNEDLDAYPRDFQRDSALCKSLGADLIFHPEPEDMYTNPCAYVSIDTLSENLCGKTRPIHFKGVCTVIEAEPLAKIDYVSMVDALTMQDVTTVDRDVLVAMAVYIGKTRLIDNFSYEV